MKSSENDKYVCVFGCLCVFFTCVYGENATHANIKNTYTPTFRGVKIDPELCFLNVNSRLKCDFKRSTVKQTRKMHMDVCVYGPFWRSAPHKKCRNAPYTHTHIHTHFCFLFFKASNHALFMPVFGKSALFTRKECTFGN